MIPVIWKVHSYHMPYKRRYGNTDDIEEEIKRRRERRPPEEINSFEPTETGNYRPPQPSQAQLSRMAQSMKQDPTKPHDLPNRPVFRDEPNLYEDGPAHSRTINPAYNTSIGQDMLAGAGVALGQRTGNPFHDLGLALGGLGGGAFKKNLAGKIQHKQDVGEVREENRQIEIKSQAQIRWEAEERRRQQEERMQAQFDWRRQYQEEQSKRRTMQDKNKLDLEILQTDPDENNRRAAAEALSARTGQNISPEAGRDMKQVQAGDYLTLMDQFGNIRTVMDPETGKPISKLTTSGYLDILKKVRDLSDFEDDAMKSALQQAEQLIKEQKLPFKTTTSQSVATINLAKTILQNQGKKTGKVTIGDEVMEIEIPPMHTPEGKPMAPPPANNSPFIQNSATDPNGNSNIDADYQEGPTAVQLLPKYQDFKAVPVGEDLDPQSLPLDGAGFTKMLSTAESQAPKGATKFKFELEGATYEYNFKTKKVKRIK